jgi:hypothetical protein
MSEIGENLKSFLKKGIEVIGNKASDLASNAKQKVGEYNLANEKKDLFSAIGSKIYDNYLNGDTVPEGLEEELTRITEIDQELEAIRAEKEKAGESAESNAGEPGERVQTEEEVSAEEPAAAEYAAKDDSDVPVIEIEEEAEKEKVGECPLSSAINDLFENMPPVDKMVDKVNSSLDDLGENLRKFSSDFDKKLKDFSDQMMEKDDSDKKE